MAIKRNILNSTLEIRCDYYIIILKLSTLIINWIIIDLDQFFFK